MDDRIFKQKRESALNKKDRSSKGCIDEKMLPLVDAINSSEEYFTTSSCSGRFNIIKRKSSKKTDSEWVFVSHERIEDDQVIIDKLNETEGDGIVWFKLEPSILHVCAKSVEAAERLFAIARDAGYKRSGIVSIKNVIIVEVIGTDSIENLMIDQEGRYYDDNYVKSLVRHANSKMDRNHQKIERFTSKLKEYLNTL